jgi:hypothetical protein
VPKRDEVSFDGIPHFPEENDLFIRTETITNSTLPTSQFIILSAQFQYNLGLVNRLLPEVFP